MEKLFKHMKKLAMLWDYLWMTNNSLMQSKKQVKWLLKMNSEDCLLHYWWWILWPNLM